MDGKIKVLCIAGTGRNGSTLLGNILGQAESFTNVGELLDLGVNLAPGRPPCGCGAPLSDCDKWEAVLREAFEWGDQSFVARMHRLRIVEPQPRNIALYATSAGTQKLNRRFARNLEDLERLFRAIQKVFKSAVIVDSSKRQPMYLHLLRSIDAIDLHVVHLVRDPRALAFAYQRRIVREGYVLDMSPLRSSLDWVRRNLAIELLTKQLRRPPLGIRFEDLLAEPRKTVSRIVKFTGETCPKLCFDDERVVNLRPLHTVAGNPNRFTTGRIEIRSNEEWLTQMKSAPRMLVTALTWTLLTKYGYPVQTSDLRHKDMLQGGAKHLDGVSARNSKGNAEAEFADVK